MEPPSPDPHPQPFHWLALGGTLLIAAILRFYNLSHQGFVVSDEGAYVIAAKRLAAHSYDMDYSFYRPGFVVVEAWRQEYNERRPHSALGYRTPAEMARCPAGSASVMREWRGRL